MTHRVVPLISLLFSLPQNTTHFGIGLVPTSPSCGCGSFENGDDVEGNIAFVERGECSFVSKAMKAQVRKGHGTGIENRTMTYVWDEIYDRIRPLFGTKEPR